MGMTIDQELAEISDLALKIKANYEARLKSDLVAILTELQLEIDEHKMTSGVANQSTWNECIACCSRIVQQKINSLKETKDGKDTSGYFEKEVYEAEKPYMDEYLNN